LEQAMPAWAALRAYCRDLNGEVRFTSTTKLSNQASPEPTVTRWRILQSPTCASLEFQRNGEPDLTIVHAINSQYGFVLVDNKKPGNWILKQYIPNSDDQSFPEGSIRDRADLFTGCHLTVLGLPIEKLVRHPLVRKIEWTWDAIDGKRVARVEFESKHEFDVKHQFPIQGGVMYLDPAASWCLRRYEITGEWPSSTGRTVANFVVQNEFGFPVCKRVVVESDYAMSEGRATSVYFADTSFQRPSSHLGDEKFYLSAYGLPNPVGKEPPRRTHHLWLIGAGTCCLALYFIIRRMQKPQATMSPS
jgi:hypothetical protein